MVVILSGAELVLPDRVVGPGTLVVDHGRIVEVRHGIRPDDGSAFYTDLHGCVIAPGFVDVHVHGLAGHDVLDGPEAVMAVADRLPRHGVTAFCPTAVACPPAVLRRLLTAVAEARVRRPSRHARVLPAHLESSFISHEYRGAQPAACIRLPPGPPRNVRSMQPGTTTEPAGDSEFTGEDVAAEIERHVGDVAIVTLAPELPGALDLVRELTRGCRVSVGHTGAGYEEGLASIAAGASHATHLFNRMRPFHHRDPGLTAAVLQADSVAAEVICDGLHVHPGAIRLAVDAKGVDRVMAITDGTAVAGLPEGARSQLGGQPIVGRGGGAYLDDGTLAGSTCTMDRALRTLVQSVGLTLPEAMTLCATTPARELGLSELGSLVGGAVADLVVLDRDLRVVHTYVAGELAYSAR